MSRNTGVAIDQPATIDAGSTQRPPLELVERLCRALGEGGINYCHWKSNEALDRSASGENDLDLLIARSDARRFASIVLEVGFKEARLPAGRELPGIADWYGLDAASDRPVHLHAHFQLILGDDMTKDARLPIERAYLASAVQGPVFKVPSPDLELIVFVIRMVLKHASWDAIAMAQGRSSASERRELVWLLERADLERVDALLDEHLPWLGRAVFHQCLESIRPTSGIRRRVAAARTLRRRLRSHARHDAATDTWLKVQRRIRFAFVRKVLGQRARKRPAAGGCLVAIVGGDGSGKSSVVEHIVGTFGRDLAVRRFHLGKPRRSPASQVFRTVVRGARVFGWFAETRLPPTAETIPQRAPGLAFILWHVGNARDRRRTYLQARRYATEGGIAVCDRYPLPSILAMDGPRCGGAITDPDASRLAVMLAKREMRCYQEIMGPDLLVVLRVDPEIAAQRRPEQDRDFVVERSSEVAAADWSGTPAVVVDANRPADQVAAEVRALVWSHL